MDLAQRRYPPEFDVESATMWFRQTVMHQPTVFYPIRTDSAFLIALTSTKPWMPSRPEAHVIMLCVEKGAGWETLTLVRACAAWARRRNCVTLEINPGTEFGHRYVLRL